MTNVSNENGTPVESSILILEDGRILARNVSSRLAVLLQSLSPQDQELAARLQTALVELPVTPPEKQLS